MSSSPSPTREASSGNGREETRERHSQPEADSHETSRQEEDITQLDSQTRLSPTSATILQIQAIIDYDDEPLPRQNDTSIVPLPYDQGEQDFSRQEETAAQDIDFQLGLSPTSATSLSCIAPLPYDQDSSIQEVQDIRQLESQSRLNPTSAASVLSTELPYYDQEEPCSEEDVQDIRQFGSLSPTSATILQIQAIIDNEEELSASLSSKQRDTSNALLSYDQDSKVQDIDSQSRLSPTSATILQIQAIIDNEEEFSALLLPRQRISSLSYSQEEQDSLRQEEADAQDSRQSGSQSGLSPTFATVLQIPAIIEYEEEPSASLLTRQRKNSIALLSYDHDQGEQDSLRSDAQDTRFDSQSGLSATSLPSNASNSSAHEETGVQDTRQLHSQSGLSATGLPSIVSLSYNQRDQASSRQEETDAQDIDSVSGQTPTSATSFASTAVNSSRHEEANVQDMRQLDFQLGLSSASATNLQIQAIIEYDEEPSASPLSRQRYANDQLPTEHAQQSSSPSGASTPQRTVAASRQRDTDNQLPTEHAQQSSSPSGASTPQRTVAASFSSRQRDTDDQLPTEHAQQSSSPSGASTPQRTVAASFSSRQRDTDNQLPTEHAQQSSSSSGASTPQRTVAASRERDTDNQLPIEHALSAVSTLERVVLPSFSHERDIDDQLPTEHALQSRSHRSVSTLQGAVAPQRDIDDQLPTEHALQFSSHSAVSTLQGAVAPSLSSRQRDIDDQLPTEHALQSSSHCAVSTIQGAVAPFLSSRQRYIDDQLPTEHALQSRSHNAVSTLQGAAAFLSSHQRETDHQLPTEHALQSSSHHAVSTLQGAVAPSLSSRQRDIDDQLPTEHALQSSSHRTVSTLQGAVAPSLSSRQRYIGDQLPTEHALQSSSHRAVPSLQGAVAPSLSSRQRYIGDQLPTEHAHQSRRPSGVSTLQREIAAPFSSGQRDINDQLPTEHAQQPSSPSGVTTLQRAVVVEGRLNWRDDNEADTEIAHASTPDGTSGAHEETVIYPEKQTEVISNIITALYSDAQRFDPNDPYQAPCCEACTDIVCQKSNCKSILKTRDLLLSDTLRRGRAQGWNMLAKIIFPLLPDTARKVWVAGELITAVLGFGLSVAAVLLRPQDIFGIVHICLIALFTIFVIIDEVVALKDCKACKKCYHIYKGKYHSRRQHAPYFKCCTIACVTRSKNALDATRVVITELTLYPLVVCDIFKVITGRRYAEEAPLADYLAIALLVLTSISFIVHVYIARVAILVIAMKKILAIRSPNYKLIKNYDLLRQNRFDFSIRKSSFWYQLYILVHTILQMITQILIFVAIGASMYKDNQNLFSDNITDRSVHFSIYLWYLIGMGFIMPILGLFSSILVTYYWTQEFAIGLCLDIVSIWNMGGPEDFVHVKEQLQDRQGTWISRVINRFLKVEELKSEFKQFREKKWPLKLLYSYTSSVVIITCTIYVILQAVLVFDAIIEIGGESESESGWVHFYIVAFFIFAVIANAFSNSVIVFWTVAILGSIMAVFSMLLLIPCTEVIIVIVILYKRYNKQ